MTTRPASTRAELPASLVHRNELFIGGRWVAPGGGTAAVRSPADGETVGTAPVGTSDDIDAAVAAARHVVEHGEWAGLSPKDRSLLLHRFADELDNRSASTAALVTVQNGMPISLSSVAEGTAPQTLLSYYADLIAEETPETVRRAVGRRGTTVIRHKPVGVVGAVVPWNYPRMLAMFKIAPALAAGCAVVLKPAAETPLDALALADAALAAGLPAGVLNIVTGGLDAGQALVAHPGVDKIGFTGSTSAGRSIGEICGRLLRPATLELGGKSAAVVLDDCDPQVLARGLPGVSLLHASQTCYSCTRILVPRSRSGEYTDAIVAAVRSLPIGDPFDTATKVGPLISTAQRDRVLVAIEEAVTAGARVVTGGAVPDGLAVGAFLSPTVLVGVDNSFDIARRELFAPVLSVIEYDDIDSAVAIANDSEYGLGGSVWTADEERGMAVARRIDTGAIGINFFALDFGAPFGGMKASGVGRELGPEGLAAYRLSSSIYRRT